MALTRTIQLSFWTDSKVVDDFTPEDRYFYLYLMTNPHTNVCGCYEISIKQMSDETGYSKETVEKLINRMVNVHKVICFSNDTKEILLLNWSKYNWTRSDKFQVAVEREISHVKEVSFRDYLTDIYNGVDTVSIRYPYGMDTSFSLYSNTNNLNTNSNKDINKSNIKKSYFNDPDLDDLFNELLEQRKKQKVVNTERAIQMLVKKVYEYSNGNKQAALEIIGQSVENSWKGIFPLKGNKGIQTMSQIDAIMNA